jgi:hypothetical protein
MRHLVPLALLLAACGTSGRGYTGGPGGDGNPDLVYVSNADWGDIVPPGGGQQGCGELAGCYTVYAHSNTVLYHIDLPNKMLVTVGPFNAPNNENMTDLAVAPDNTIYVVSNTTLYTASPTDGHVTSVAPLGVCGSQSVALTFENDGTLYAADFKGPFCKIDLTAHPPTVHQITSSIGNGMAIAGDLVAVSDGTMFGTAYKIADGSTGPTALNNLLVKIDPTTGQATQTLGSTGFPKLFGVAFSDGKVFGFTHDGSGRVVTIDPHTGAGTLYGTFMDGGKAISFSGAGVNSMVMAPPPG